MFRTTIDSTWNPKGLRFQAKVGRRSHRKLPSQAPRTGKPRRIPPTRPHTAQAGPRTPPGGSGTKGRPTAQRRLGSPKRRHYRRQGNDTQQPRICPIDPFGARPTHGPLPAIRVHPVVAIPGASDGSLWITDIRNFVPRHLAGPDTAMVSLQPAAGVGNRIHGPAAPELDDGIVVIG